MDVFAIHAHDRESVIGQLSSPVPLVSAPVLNGLSTGPTGAPAGTDGSPGFNP